MTKTTAKLVKTIATVCAAGLVVAGCSSADEANTTGESNTSADSAASAEGKFTVTDNNGEVELDAMPEKIVVLDYSVLDVIDSLGKGDSVVLTPTNNNPPAFAEEYADTAEAGGMSEPDLEAIASAEPDVILMGARTAREPSLVEELGKIAPALDYSTDYTEGSLDLNLETAHNLAGLFGEDAQKEADEKIEAIQKRADELKDKVEAEDLNALILMTNGGETHAFAPGSRFGAIHNAFGFKEAAEVKMDGRYGEVVSFEYIADADPDYIFVIDRDAARGSDEATAAATLDNPLVQGTKAAQNDNIVYLSPELWYLMGGGINNVGAMIGEVEAAL